MTIQSNSNYKPSDPYSVSGKTAQARIDKFVMHAYNMLKDLEKTAPLKQSETIAKIYSEAHKNLLNIYNKLEIKNEKKGLTKKEVKVLAKQLKQSEKNIVKVIQKAQSQVAGHVGTEFMIDIGSKERARIKEHITTLAKGGWKAKAIKLLALVSNTHALAIDHFGTAKKLMHLLATDEINPDVKSDIENQKDKSYRKTIKIPSYDKIDSEKLSQFKEFQKGNDHLSRRAGVIGVDKIYRLAVTFDKKAIHKQLKSYTAQKLSEKIRKPIIKENIHKFPLGSVTSKQIPLNRHFDEQFSYVKNGVFGPIVGEKGISSANRQESHLINAWETKLELSKKGESENQILFRGIRHGIISGPSKEENNSTASQELLKAAALQEISDLGWSLEKAKKNGISLTLNSVSMVTPDDIRAMKKGSEKQMLKDQLKALKALKDLKEIEIDGVRIPIKTNVNAFNFGVNAGAVGFFKFGTRNQHKQNLEALKDLEEQVNATMAMKDLISDIDLKNIESLMKDIKELMATPTSYLKSDNQYEVGAKILNLTNILNSVMGSGFKCAFNCKSGKDRTGIMDGVAKAYASMAAQFNGLYPTHKDLATDESTRRIFKETVLPILMEGGGLDITEINTDAAGFKVTEHALIGGLKEEKEEIFMKLVGLSKTTSS